MRINKGWRSWAVGASKGWRSWAVEDGRATSYRVLLFRSPPTFSRQSLGGFLNSDGNPQQLYRRQSHTNDR